MQQDPDGTAGQSASGGDHPDAINHARDESFLIMSETSAETPSASLPCAFVSLACLAFSVSSLPRSHCPTHLAQLILLSSPCSAHPANLTLPRSPCSAHCAQLTYLIDSVQLTLPAHLPNSFYPAHPTTSLCPVHLPNSFCSAHPAQVTCQINFAQLTFTQLAGLQWC